MSENNKTTLNNEILSQLSEEERKLTLSILKEYSEKGQSKIFNDLLAEDYREIPVDIITFILDNRYLGKAWHDAEGKSKLYPFWEKKMQELFPDGYTTNVNNLIVSGARGLGKAQPLYSKVFTQRGYVSMGEITLDDFVYGADGLLHPILAIFPQGKKKIYEIEFSDHTKTRCSDEHLWTVRCNLTHRRDYKTLTLNELLSQPLKVKAKSGALNSRYSIPLCRPLEFASNDTFIDPYLLGCLLGDGHISRYIKLSGIDQEIFDSCEKLLNKNDYTFTPYTDCSCGIKRIHKSNKQNEYVTECINLGINKIAHAKFIPDKYKYNDIKSRIALLQGLMDTDGNISKDGLCSFTTVSKQLADDFMFLVQSLGGTTSLQIRANKKYKYSATEYRDCATSYSIRFKLSKDIIPVRLQRKAINLLSNRKQPVRTIDSITYIGEEECQCILVDSQEHLYLTDNLIVTHNSELSITALAYLMYRVLCLKNPQQHFKLKPTEKISFAFMNITKILAEDIGISKFQATIQMSPWFMERGSITQRNNEPYWIPPEPVEIIIGSQSSHVIGQPIFAAFFDEISFIRNQDIDKQKKIAIDMIDTAIGGMKTRFISKGKNPTLLILASSKRSEKSFLEEHMKRKLKSEEANVMIVDEAVWTVKPKGTYSEKTFKVALGNKFLQSTVLADSENVEPWLKKGYQILNIPIDFKANFVDDIDRALTDFAGISSSELSKYINGANIQAAIVPERSNLFTKEQIEVGNAPDDTTQYKDFFDLTRIPAGMKEKPLFIHLDMSVSGDATGIAGTWIKGKRVSTTENQSKDLFFSLAFSISIKAPKGRQISFEKNRNFIYWLKEQGFNIKGVSSDTYQSYDTGQALLARGFPYEILSVDRVDADHICKPYQYLKSTIDERRFEMYNSPLLVGELIDLERNINTGKIDHPVGSHKDVADGVCGSIFNASKHAEQFAYEWGESLDVIKDVNTQFISDEAIRQQITVEFEEEMKKAFSSVAKKAPAPLATENKTQQKNTPTMNPIVGDGIIIW